MVADLVIKMSDKCKNCVKVISGRSLKLQCVDCKSFFHGGCVGMSKEDIDFIQSENQIWRCESCNKNRRASMRVETELDKNIPDLSDVMKLLQEMRQESKEQTRNLEHELGTSIELCHKTISDLRQTIELQSESLNKYKDLYDKLYVEHNKLQLKVIDLENRYDDSEQYSRLNTVEINGIPEQMNENLLGLIQKVGNCLDLQINEDTVDACHRLGSKRVGEERPRGIVVKFTRRIIKDELLTKRRVKRNLNTSDMDLPGPARVVYINESLTPTRRRIFNEVRVIKKEKGFTFVWVRNGKILVRPSEGDKVTVVTNWSDVEKLRKLPAIASVP